MLRPKNIVVTSYHTVDFGFLKLHCTKVIITTTYRLIGKFDKGLDSSRVGFASHTMEKIFLGPLGVTTSIILWPDTGDYVKGMLEHFNEKKEQNW